MIIIQQVTISNRKRVLIENKNKCATIVVCMNSKEKGKRGERDLSKVLSTLFNVNARRGQQYKGTDDSPDVIAFDGVHVECKRTERFNPYKALEQANNDAGENIPVVMHKRNYKPWIVVIELENLPDFIAILQEYI